MDDRAASALKTYRDKRNFDLTPEPATGGVANEADRAFVVQKHWASRLHYDLRLELEGTMKSWAVPKGPSFDPSDKRMAVQVEDHPIAYNRFEGTIPPGQYGAGKVIVWDKGRWLPLEDPVAGYREGKLKFELRGHKLHGRWTLIRIKGPGSERQEPWLLIKEKDEHVRPSSEFSVVDEMPDSVSHLPERPVDPPPESASPEPPRTRKARQAKGHPVAESAQAESAQAADAPAAPATGSGPPAGAKPAELPEALEPELATLVDGPPADPQNWIYEIKFDGYRMLARAQAGQVRLVTRNGNDWSHKLQPLQAALQSMDLPDGWYDGEIIMPGREVPADFQALQGAFDSARTGDIVYYLFDIPYCAGHDLREVPLEQRREVLQRVVERKPHDKVRFSAVFDAPPEEVVASACRLGLEGVIAKRRSSAYLNRRSADWVKLKCGRRQEFVIGGYTDPQGSRTGIGSLLLGVHGEGGELRYAGNVGTGFNEKTLRELREKLDGLGRARSPFGPGAQIPKKPHWVDPVLVCEVAFGEWTRDGRVRHAVFHGLRTDKPAAAITREQPTHASAGDSAGADADKAAPQTRRRAAGPAAVPVAARKRTQAALPGAAAGASARLAAALPASLRVSHPERVIDPATGTTKLDLVRYYALVGPLMMEHLQGRPVALVRAPGGIGGELFFQKHAERYSMPGIEALDASLYPGHPPMLEVARAEGLLSGAQMNVIEFHTWNAVKSAIDKPDRMTFDLDPGEGIGWREVQEAAQLVRAFLGELRLPAFLKTSGGKGLHVVVPLKKQYDWDGVKGFSQAIVQHLAQTLPQRFVAKSGPKNRIGKIFIDYLRNGFGATTVAAWSARSRPGLGISVPVRWDELEGLSGGAHWSVASVHTRLDQGNAPWEGYAGSATALGAAMKALGYKPG